MEHLRPARILAIAVGAAAFLAVISHVRLSGQEEDRIDPDAADRLERIAEHHFESARGLSPCQEGDTWLLLQSARNRLVSIGESKANLIVVVAPTFSEIELIAIGPDYIRAYRFPGQTGFTPPSSEWFSPTPLKISDISLTPSEQFAIVTPIRRHITYAMTAREYGFDGVGYYFGNGDVDCAFAWTPHGTGPSGLIVDMVAEASGQAASVTKLLALARAIDRADGAR